MTALNLDEVVKMVRSKLFELLPRFPQLQILKVIYFVLIYKFSKKSLPFQLGSGSGGVSEVFLPKFLNGLAVMERLVVFSLTYDCNDEILRVLQRNCGGTLKVMAMVFLVP